MASRHAASLGRIPPATPASPRASSTSCVEASEMTLNESAGAPRHPQPLDEPHGQVEPLHISSDVGTTAVDHDRVHADIGEQDDVARKLLPQTGVRHRRAAVLDHHGPAMKLTDIGQRLQQRADVSHVVYSELNLTYSGE